MTTACKHALMALVVISILTVQAEAGERSSVAGLKEMAGDAGKALPPAPAAQGRPVPRVEHYAGFMEVDGVKRSACFTLSTEVDNPHEGDPDVRGDYSTQEVLIFREEGVTPCDHRWLQRNGPWIRTCSGHFLIFSSLSPLSEGEVYTTLQRFNPNTGELAVPPVGRFKFKKAASCERKRRTRRGS